MSKTVGIVMIVFGAALIFIFAAWAMVNIGLDPAARVMVLGVAIVIAAPLIGFGVVALAKGVRESGEDAVIRQQRKLMGMVMTQGKLNLADAALELRMTREQIRQLVYDLISKRLFSGYVDWDGGMLYSEDASKLKGGKCPKCGGELTLAGKGLVKCAYCGAEVFGA